MPTSWIRWDVDYFTNPKAITAGVEGRALHMASACWSGMHATDGYVPADAVRVLCMWADVPQRKALDRVVDSGLWVANGTGFVLPGYLERNPSRADVERERAAQRERQRRYRSRRE